MKHFLLLLLFFIAAGTLPAQKYILLDTRIAMPVQSTNSITAADKYNGYFPIEKKNINQFIKALQEISSKLSATEAMGEPKQYEIGCVKFIGVAVPTAKEQRLDYVLTSDCDNLKISMHLCNAKISNASNAYFINTWIKYIKNGIR